MAAETKSYSWQPVLLLVLASKLLCSFSCQVLGQAVRVSSQTGCVGPLLPSSST